jgi:hypothetical protein
MNTAELRCSNGIALVDQEDYLRVLGYSWCIISGPKGDRYVRAFVGGQRVRLHHFLFGFPPAGFEVDHINGDGLDNRKENLRFASLSENRSNSRIWAGKEVPFKGVKRLTSGRFQARIRRDKQEYCLGTFDTAEEAACEYDTAARRFSGEFAAVNFPREGERGCR